MSKIRYQVKEFNILHTGRWESQGSLNSSLSFAPQLPGVKSCFFTFSSVQFSCSVLSDSLLPHESRHARPPCPSPTPGVHPNPCPSSWWCHPAISSSVVPFSSHPQSFSASEMSQLFASGGQSIGVSASTSVLPMNTQDCSALGWTDWISLQSKGLSRVYLYICANSVIFWVDVTEYRLCVA